ncbi:MAG TPA: glycosyltransferase, partial [Thermodesulfobacteriota bacterium]|nr:glycosyltransferase [Thermodesulfobacteriota bacterium]
KLCLRSIRKFTPQPYKVIVVDNDSKDGSLEYLKSVKWLHLIQRRAVAKKGSWAHGSALDIGLTDTQTEFFLALHSDVIIKDSSWLSMLLTPFQKNSVLACVGTGKLEDVSTAYRVFKKMGDTKGLLRFLKTNLLHRPDQVLPEYIRTTCAAYRTEILKKENLSFLPREEPNMTSGQALYYTLVQKGYQTLYLPPSELKKVVDHVCHGTMILNPALGARKRTIAKGIQRIKRQLSEGWIKSLLEDSTLDQ